MTFENAIATLKVGLLARTQEDEALNLLLNESVRMRAALKFYAELGNYLDGTPMLHEFSQDDEGFTARRALRMDDYPGAVMVPGLNYEEGNDAR